MSTVLLDHLKTVGNSVSPPVLKAELARSVDLLMKQFYGVCVFQSNEHAQSWMAVCQYGYYALQRPDEDAVYYLRESRKFHEDAAAALTRNKRLGVRAEEAAQYAADWPREQASKEMLLQLGLAGIRLKRQAELLGEPLSIFQAIINMNKRQDALEESLEELEPQPPLAQPYMGKEAVKEAAGPNPFIKPEGESEMGSSSHSELCSQYSYRRRSRP
jgi:hypothetical protein